MRFTSRWPWTILLALCAGCSSGGGSDAGLDARVVETDAPTGGDAPTAEDAPIAADAPVAADAPTGADAPTLADSGPPGPCTDDAREDDDTLEAALAASAVYSLTGTTELSSLVACPGDDDFVHGYSDCCDLALGAEISWPAASGTLELTVLAPDGSTWPVDEDVDEPGNARRIDDSPSSAGDFVVRIHNPGTTPIPYDATIHARVFGP